MKKNVIVIMEMIIINRRTSVNKFGTKIIVVE